MQKIIALLFSPCCVFDGQGFRAEVLTTRSRAETATMKRRQEMEEEIERHDRERLLTARPEDLEQEYVPSPTSAQDILVCSYIYQNMIPLIKHHARQHLQINSSCPDIAGLTG